LLEESQEGEKQQIDAMHFEGWQNDNFEPEKHRDQGKLTLDSGLRGILGGNGNLH